MQYTPYVVPLLISGVLLLGIGFYARQSRGVPATIPFVTLMFLCAVWALAYAGDIASDTVAGKVVWEKVIFTFLPFVPVAMLSLAARHTGAIRSVTWCHRVLLFVVPLLTVALSLTSDAHTLFSYNYRLAGSEAFPTIRFDSGPWYWVHIVYSYALVVAALVVFAGSLRGATLLYRRQTLALMVGTLFPLVVDLLFALDITPLPGYNLAPAAFVLSGLIVSWALFRYRIFDVVPIARATVMENMADLALVLDARDRLVDVNSAARYALHLDMSKAVGQPVHVVLAHLPLVVEAYRAANSDREIILGEEPNKEVYDVSTTAIKDDRGNLAGRLLLLRDVTERERAEQEIQKLYQQEQKLVQELRALLGIGLAITSGLDMDQMLKTLLDQCRRVLPIDVFYVAVYDSQANTISFPLVYHVGEYHSLPPRHVNDQPSITVEVIQRHQTLYLPDMLDPETVRAHRYTSTGGDPTRSYVGVPLIVGEQVVGVLSMQSHDPSAFGPGQIRLLETIAPQVAVAIQNSRTYEQAQREIAQRRQVETFLREANAQLQAYLTEIETLHAKLREQAIRDSLTGLYNRRYLEESLERDLARALREGAPLSVVMIDIDRFKEVNDAFGHEASDLMLRAFGKLLQGRTRHGDIACRFGGEEFVVVLPSASSDEIVQRAEEWRLAFNSLRVNYGGQAVRATISLGVASFPAHASTGNGLLRAADRALYEAKAAGRDRTVVYTGVYVAVPMVSERASEPELPQETKGYQSDPV